MIGMSNALDKAVYTDKQTGKDRKIEVQKQKDAKDPTVRGPWYLSHDKFGNVNKTAKTYSARQRKLYGQVHRDSPRYGIPEIERHAKTQQCNAGGISPRQVWRCKQDRISYSGRQRKLYGQIDRDRPRNRIPEIERQNHKTHQCGASGISPRQVWQF